MEKPLGHKSYGHIPHLPGSRLGPGDHKCSEGQARICTQTPRDKYDRIIVQEKLDGANVGVAKIDGVLYPLTRKGYVANTSSYQIHHLFYDWAMQNKERFMALLSDGERACGECLIQAHGTRYNLPHEPFVLFDIMTGHDRITYEELKTRADQFNFVTPYTFSIGPPVSIEEALQYIICSHHGAIDPVEGAVWRVERYNTQTKKWYVDFLAKYVRPDKIDGLYLKGEPVWNTYPGCTFVSSGPIV